MSTKSPSHPAEPLHPGDGVVHAPASVSRNLLPGLAIFLLAIVAHHPVISNGFINLDDPLYVTANERVRAGLSLENVRWAATSVDAYNWHPLTWLSHMLDVQLWGMDARLHHLTNLLLHGLNALLLFHFLRRATGATWRPFAVAALFAVHPLHVESVAWIAERKDVLFAFFFLATLVVYSAPDFVRSSWRIWAALGAFSCSLMAKPMAVTLPVVLMVLDWWPLQRWNGGETEPPSRTTPLRLALQKAPFFALAAASAVVTLLVQHRGGTGTVIHESPLSLNARNAVVSYLRYVGKAFWPADLAVVYPFRPAEASLPAALASVLVVSLALILAWRFRSRSPWILTGLLWFLITLLPVIGLLRIGRHAIADRYTYIPMVGLYVAVVWQVGAWTTGRRRWRIFAALAGAATIALLAGLSVEQGRRWRSSRTLLEHAIRVTGENALAERNLGVALASEGDIAAAGRHAQLGRLLESKEVAELHPTNPDAQFRLAVLYAEAGQFTKAIDQFRVVLLLAPGFPGAWNNLGVSLARSGRVEEAERAFAEALQVNPRDESARRNLESLRAERTRTR